jgi:hypothetical protein
MNVTLNAAFGVFCVVVGVLWVVRPVTMSKLQQRFLFFGAGGDDVEINETLGRVTGGVLAVAGLYLVVGT